MHPRENPFTNRLKRLWFSAATTEIGADIGLLLRFGLGALSLIYRLIWSLRSAWFRAFPPRTAPRGVRVIAIGNLIVGGAGKTPCALAVADGLRNAGIACGFISRGYRSQAESMGPLVVQARELGQTPPTKIGDEAWLLSWRSGLPIAVGRNRWDCLQALLSAQPALRAVILDDGLQQRTLASDEQILLTDERGFGNGLCLPAGPLREPVGDLTRFSMTVRRGKELSLQQAGWVSLGSMAAGDPAQPPMIDLAEGVQRFAGQKILAAAGIAEPQRFFDELRGLGLEFESLALGDHDARLPQVLEQRWQSGQYDVVLMTEKDAVKFFNTRCDLCNHAWALRQEPQLDPVFISRLIDGFKTA